MAETESNVGGAGGSLLIANVVVSGGAVSNITISGLDINTDGGYEVIFEPKTPDVSPTDPRLSMYFNADLDSANYSSGWNAQNYFSGPNEAFSGIRKIGFAEGGGSEELLVMTISRAPSGRVGMTGTIQGKGANLQSGVTSLTHDVDDSNLTSITFDAKSAGSDTNLTNFFLDGSRVRVKKLY